MKSVLLYLPAIFFVITVFSIEVLSKSTDLITKNIERITLTIKNKRDLQIAPLDIDLFSKYNVDKFEVRMIVLGSGGATDLGAYRKAFLIFDNQYEMPWRYSVFPIGQFGSVERITQVSNHEFRIEGMSFAESENLEALCDWCKVEVMVDISSLIKKEKQMDEQGDDYEGDIESEVTLVILKISE